MEPRCGRSGGKGSAYAPPKRKEQKPLTRACARRTYKCFSPELGRPRRTDARRPRGPASGRSVLASRKVCLGFALRGRALRSIQASGHALFDVSPERPDRCAVFKVREPDFQADDVRRTWAGELVDETHARYHVRGLDGGADHSKNQIVPVLVDLPAADRGLELELEVAAIRVHLVLPLRADVLAKYHDGVNDVESVGLFANHALLFEKLAGLRHVVPELPEILRARERRDFVRRVGVVRRLAVRGLHDLLPDRPRIAERQVVLQALLVFLLTLCSELQVRIERAVEAQIRHGCEV
mmetsp:Transcript_71488/g.198429  ORF Transcript_71488/g.198429 Transcript_71488/m.198429 type:complete len:296 (+) Transcript_71488:83-970(+)